MIESIRKEEPAQMLSRTATEADAAKSAGTNIALLALCLIASFVSFWNIKLTFDVSEIFSIGWVTILLYVVTVTVYKTKYDGGMAKGRKTDEYKEAERIFSSFVQKITDGMMIDALREWCNEFRRKDLESVRKDIISPFMTYEEYIEKYSNLDNEKVKGLSLPSKIKKAIKQANAVDPVDLTADMLLGRSFTRKWFSKRRMLPISGDSRRQMDLVINYANVFFRTFICGMFVIDIVSDPTLDTFIQWMIRMIPIVMALITGSPAGYRNATEVSVRRIDAQTKILGIFLAAEGK